MAAIIEALPYLVVAFIYGWAAVATWRLLRRKDSTQAGRLPRHHERTSAIRYMLLSLAYAWIVSLHVAGSSIIHWNS